MAAGTPAVSRLDMAESFMIFKVLIVLPSGARAAHRLPPPGKMRCC